MDQWTTRRRLASGPRRVHPWPVSPLALVLALAAGSVAAPPATVAPEASPELCGLVARCGLGPPPASCPAAALPGVPEVAYDAERCRPARELAELGLSPADPRHAPLYRFLGERYQASFTVDGEVPLSEARLGFLLADVPLAARLVTHFQGTRYEAEYLDPSRRRFRASREDRLRGEAEEVAGGPAEGQVLYFGRGSSELGPWKLHGRGLVRADWGRARGGGLWYRVHLLASPANTAIDRVMKLGLFRRLVSDYVREVVEDLAEATRRLDASGDAALVQAGRWTPEERGKLTRLLALPR